MADQTRDSIEIAASPEEVMAVIADVASYPEWVSAMKQVDIVSTHPDGKPDHVKIKLEHSVVSDHYTLAYRWLADSVSWNLVEGQLLKAMDGSYELDAVRPGHQGHVRPVGRCPDADDRDVPAQGREDDHRRRAQGSQAAGGGLNITPGSAATTRPRPARDDRPSPDRPLSIGIDIGGTKVAAGVVDAARHDHRAAAGADPLAQPAGGRGRHRRPGHPSSASRHAGVESVGIGAAGWVDNTQSIVRFSPHLAWREEPLKDRLHERIDLPLIVDNDANAAAWSEYRFGAGRGSSVMVCITLGTGIGGGLVINGDLFRGTYGMAGEWGHMISVPGGHRCECGNRGCWEQYASGNALVREARELARSNSPMAYRLLEMLGGDPDQITGPGVTAAAARRGSRPRSSCWPTSGSGWARASPTWPPRSIPTWW